MTTHHRPPLILIYGNSPRLIDLERTLRATPNLRVIQIDPDDPSAADQVAVLRAGALIYDDGADLALIQALSTLHLEMVLMDLGGADGRQVMTNLGQAIHLFSDA